jgi:hypothetical protein
MSAAVAAAGRQRREYGDGERKPKDDFHRHADDAPSPAGGTTRRSPRRTRRAPRGSP